MLRGSSTIAPGVPHPLRMAVVSCSSPKKTLAAKKSCDGHIFLTLYIPIFRRPWSPKNVINCLKNDIYNTDYRKKAKPTYTSSMCFSIENHKKMRLRQLALLNQYVE
jgi:hypothetical protein